MQSFTDAAHALRDRVLASGISYRKLAAAAGINDRTIAYFVRNGSSTPDTLDRIRGAVEKLAPAVSRNAQN